MNLSTRSRILSALVSIVFIGTPFVASAIGAQGSCPLNRFTNSRVGSTGVYSSRDHNGAGCYPDHLPSIHLDSSGSGMIVTEDVWNAVANLSIGTRISIFSGNDNPLSGRCGPLIYDCIELVTSTSPTPTPVSVSTHITQATNTPTSSTDIGSLQTLIQSLLAQIQVLQEKIRRLNTASPTQTIPNDFIGNCVGNGCDTSAVVQDVGETSVQGDSVISNTCHYFSRNLSVGSRGDDVLRLQQMLAGDGLLQQNNMTGYFGAQTKVALGLWQIASGIPQVGAFGPKSRAFLKQNCGGGETGGGIIYPNDPPLYACTQDAVLCPDGSYVGRTGPKCEAICPSPTTACVPRPACLDTAPYCQIDIPNVCP
ncbi:MAG: peptidoglycan-binding domain-containing protein [Patescibacteria group bacterium]